MHWAESERASHRTAIVVVASEHRR
eukprot:COSAG02_NODE_15144_length_1200_cov_0.978202_1_plen_24_part_10